jgi:hypothetical protein
MRYKLYLDDLRYPDLHPDWRIARNYHDAVWMVKNYGLPYHVAFDHDLADVHYNLDSDYGPLDDFVDGTPRCSSPREFTGYDFAKWFCQWVMDNDVDLTNFTWSVHSANPVGAANITKYMTSFMKDRYV